MGASNCHLLPCGIYSILLAKLALVAFGCSGIPNVRGAPSSDDNPGRFFLDGKAQDVVIPLYRKNDSHPAAVLYVHKLRLEQERRGFFKIAILERRILDGVRLHFL